MKRKNMTRNALVTSIISLLLCVSMLVGTTFAWFTDEVKSGRNTIAAGNLDIELLANGNKVDESTVLFDTDYKWEPGMVVFENLQIANVGTLALKYQLTLDVFAENELNGHKLSEVVKIAVLDEPIVLDATKTPAEQRAAILADAKDAAAQTTGLGTLNNFYLTGSLEAGVTTPEVGVVVYWEPNANEVDNLYNANNGQITSDGQPLFIEFGVNLQATQKMSENDSFGNDYDEFASLLPHASVINTGRKEIKARPSGSPFDASSAQFMTMDTSYQFLPNEEATYSGELGDLIAGNIEMDSSYRYWHADWLVSVDRPIKADSAVLAGYYRLFGEYTDGDWVYLTADLDANTPVRLLKDGMGANINYQQICAGADDGIGFLCGAADLTGENAGTTLSVELRLYETTIDPSANSGSQNIETGYYETVGKFTYTFGGNYINLPDGSVLWNPTEGGTVLDSVKDVTASDYTVPAEVTALDSGLFAGNANITAVTIPADVADFGATGVSATGASSGAFKGSAVQAVTLSEGMTEIPAAAFNGATNLTQVNIPASVTTIGVNAFRSTALTELTIPATVTNISYGAFRDMDSLTTVTIEGDSVTLPGYVFRDCSALQTVYLKMNTLTLNGNMNFGNASSGNPGTNNITFYCENTDVADVVKAHMGVGSYVAIYVDGALYAEIN